MKSTAARVLFGWTVAIIIVALLGCRAQPPQASGTPAPATPTTAAPTVAPPTAAPTEAPPTAVLTAAPPTAVPTAAPPTAAVGAIPTPEYWPTTGWKTGTPEQQGMDSAKLAAMFDAIEQRGLNLRSVLIIRNGYLVAEAYFAPYGPEVKQQVMSVTKSVSGMLTGIAVAQGRISGTDATVLSFFPGRKVANLDDNKRKMTLAHLLTLTGGFSCNDASALGPMFQSSDWVQFALDLPMARLPGQEFSYCSPAVHLISPILKQATGKDERELANEFLFAPLGIPPAGPADWDADPQKIPQGFGGLKLVPRDMAKLGFLYLHDGEWDGQQVVPAAWVAESVRPHTTETSSGRGYGYLIWLYGQQGYESMMGLGGQDIHIIPDKNLVVVFTASMDIPTHDTEVIKLLDEFVVPAAASDKPLPENPAAVEQLQARVAHAASSARPVPPLPALARSISGKVYNMDPNPNRWKTVSLTFTEGSPEAVLTIDGEGQVRIGLDNVYRKTEVPGVGAVALRGHWDSSGPFIFDADTLGSYQHWRYRTMPGSQLLIEGTENVSGTQYTMLGHAAQ